MCVDIYYKNIYVQCLCVDIYYNFSVVVVAILIND